ncbi:hypothetical protein BC828DRAFT_397136 [Blastocladiella britannica]|nr:hypothetical protein BC828DRAFT_397136 [Blastocladiella britannica]
MAMVGACLLAGVAILSFAVACCQFWARRIRRAKHERDHPGVPYDPENEYNPNAPPRLRRASERMAGYGRRPCSYHPMLEPDGSDLGISGQQRGGGRFRWAVPYGGWPQRPGSIGSCGTGVPLPIYEEASPPTPNTADSSRLREGSFAPPDYDRMSFSSRRASSAVGPVGGTLPRQSTQPSQLSSSLTAVHALPVSPDDNGIGSLPRSDSGAALPDTPPPSLADHLGSP